MESPRKKFDLSLTGFWIVCLALIGHLMLVTFGQSMVRAQIAMRNYESPYTGVIMITIAVVVLYLFALLLTFIGWGRSTRRTLIGATAAAGIAGIALLLASFLSVTVSTLI